MDAAHGAEIPGERPVSSADEATGGPDQALSDTINQLWGRALAEGNYRVTAESAVSPPWRRLRTLSIVGSPGRPSLLVENAPRDALYRSLTAYGGLRKWQPRLGRALLAAVGACGLPISRRQIHLDTRVSHPSAGRLDPLGVIERAMQQPVLMHLGVRTGDNAKATAQLFSRDGTPAGYAKIGWSDLTATFVRTEENRLVRLQGQAGDVGTPAVLCSGEVHGMPYMVTEPLPSGVRQLNHPDQAELISMATLSQIDRVAEVGSSRRLVRLMDRMSERQRAPLFARSAGPLVELSRRLLRTSTRVPILHFDHGDLVPWNACKDPSGAIWLWDWEVSEEDTVAGTDIVHWLVHALHGPYPRDMISAVAEAADKARSVHQAVGMSRTASLLSVVSYILILGERACALAESHGGWHLNRIGEDVVLELAAFGRDVLERAE